MRSERRDEAKRNGEGLRGDEADLYRRHNGELVRMVQRRLRVPRELAEDACSFAWLQLIRTQPGRDNLVGWLYTVAKYEVFAALRGERRENVVEELPAVQGGGSPEDEVEARETLRLVARLRPQQRLALGMRALGFSYNEICARTGKTYTWVNRHLTEGRQAARRLEEGR